MKRYALIVLLLAGFDVRADALMHTATALMIIDYATTMDIRRHNGIREKNNWAPSHRPLRRSDVNKYFLFKGGLHWFINTNKYTQSWKWIWNTYEIGVQFKAVHGNLNAGLHVRF